MHGTAKPAGFTPQRMAGINFGEGGFTITRQTGCRGFYRSRTPIGPKVIQ